MKKITEKELRREEVRGVFVIGAIAAIFTADQLYGKLVILGAPIEQLTAFLLFFWFLYILVMAVGVSDDIFRPKTSELARTLGRTWFMMGAIGSLVILIAAPLFYLRDHGMVWQADIGAFFLLGLPAAYFLARMVKASLEESRKRARKNSNRK